jgi:hypothetical protein
VKSRPGRLLSLVHVVDHAKIIVASGGHFRTLAYGLISPAPPAGLR